MSIRELANSMPELLAELGEYSRGDATAAIAGLFLDIRNHASLFNLEALVLLALTHADGQKSPTHRELRSWTKRIGHSAAANQTDSPEDVFASEVCWDDGNRLVMIGRQSGSDQWLRYLLLVVENLPDEDDFGQLRRSVRALLRLSDAALRAAGVQPDLLGGDAALPGRVQVDGKATVETRRQLVTFSPRRLASLGVAVADIETFVFPTALIPTVLDADVETSPLRTQPLVRAGENFVFVFLPWTIFAIRSRLLQLLGDERNREVFRQRTMAFQAREAEHALQRLHCESVPLNGLLERLDSRFPTQLKRFDVGKGLIAIFVFGRFDAAAVDEPEIHESNDELAVAIGNTIQVTVRYLSEAQACERGMVLVIGGGIGNFFQLELPRPPDNWRYLLISLPDLVALSFGIDARMMRLWRFMEAKHDFEAGPGETFSVAGELAKYAYWRSQNFSFVERWPDSGHPVFVMITDDVAGVERRDGRVTRGQHAAFHPGLRRWMPVQRYMAQTFFAADAKARLFIRADGKRDERLRCCVEAGCAALWVEVDFPQHERHFPISFNFLRCVSEWILRVAQAIDTGIQPLTRSVVVEVRLEQLEEWPHDEAPRVPPDTPPLEAVVDRENSRIILPITLAFFQSFARPINTGERELIASLLRALHAYEVIATTAAQVATLVAQIVPDDTARFFHLFANRESLVLNSGGPPTPILIAAEAHAIVRRFRDAGIPGFVNGQVNERIAARDVLFASVDKIHARLLDRLRPFSRASIIAQCLKNHSHVNAERQVWKLTSAAVSSLHGLEEAKQVAIKQESRLSEAAFGSRLLIEAALILPAGGNRAITRDVFELCLADFALLNEQANQADAIMGEMASPTLHETGLGEINFDATFMNGLVYVYQFDLLGERFAEQVANYAKEFSRDADATPRALQPAQIAFAEAWQAEYGFSLEAFVRTMNALFDEAAAVQDHLLIWPRSRLLAFAISVGGLTAETATKFVTEVCLLPRAGFDKDIPKGYSKTEVYPWIYRRRLSPLWRPVIQIDLNADPTVYIEGDFVRRAAKYRVEGVFAGDFHADRFRSKKMRSLVGATAEKRGKAFNLFALAAVRALGLWAEGEIELTTLGAPPLGPDGRGWGDVDVLAVDLRRKLVHAIECKSLMEARSVREIVDQLREFQGDRDDSLGKHLRRHEWLKANLETVAKKIGQPLDKCRLKHWIVSSKVVPMQYQTSHGIERRHFIQFSELSKALIG